MIEIHYFYYADCEFKEGGGKIDSPSDKSYVLNYYSKLCSCLSLSTSPNLFGFSLHK